MTYLLEVGQNCHILANTARFDDIVYQISGQSMQWLLSSKTYPKMAMAKSHAKKSNSS